MITIAHKVVVKPRRFGAYFYRIVFNDFTRLYSGDILTNGGGTYRVVENSPIAETKDEAIHFAKRKVIWVTKYSKGLY